MRFDARLRKLERSRKNRDSAVDPKRAEGALFLRLIMADVQAHQLACRAAGLSEQPLSAVELQSAAGALAERLDWLAA